MDGDSGEISYRYHPLMNLQTKAVRISSGPQPKRLKEIMQNN